MNSSDSIAGIVSRCSSPILRESMGSVGVTAEYEGMMEGRGGVVRRWWSGAEMGISGAVESGRNSGKRTLHFGFCVYVLRFGSAF
nr:hypothetical protein [Tanacetum cinerariifolium]